MLVVSKLFTKSRLCRANAVLVHQPNGIKPRTNDRNISTLHIVILLCATCYTGLATLLGRVATCWVWSAQVLKWGKFSCSISGCCDVVVVWPGSCNNVVPGHVTLKCWHRLYGLANTGPTMLRYVVLKNDLLAGALSIKNMLILVNKSRDIFSVE